MGWRDYLRTAATTLTRTAQHLRQNYEVHEDDRDTAARREVGNEVQYLNNTVSEFTREAPNPIRQQIQQHVASGMMIPTILGGTGALVLDLTRTLMDGRVRQAGRMVVAAVANPFIEVVAQPLEGLAYAAGVTTGDRRADSYRETQGLTGYALTVFSAIGMARAPGVLARGAFGQAVIRGVEPGIEYVAQHPITQSIQAGMQQAAQGLAPELVPANGAPLNSPPTPTAMPSSIPSPQAPTMTMMQAAGSGLNRPAGNASPTTGAGGRASTPPAEEPISAQQQRWQEIQSANGNHIFDAMESAFFGRGRGHLTWGNPIGDFFNAVGDNGPPIRMGRFENASGQVPELIISRVEGGVKIQVNRVADTPARAVVRCDPATARISDVMETAQQQLGDAFGLRNSPEFPR